LANKINTNLSSNNNQKLFSQNIFTNLSSSSDKRIDYQIFNILHNNFLGKTLTKEINSCIWFLPDPLAPTRRHRDPGRSSRLKSAKSGGSPSYANCMPQTLIAFELSFSSSSPLGFEASLFAIFGSAKNGVVWI